jgi:hypothetical protein
MSDSQTTTSHASKPSPWRVRSLLTLVALFVIVVWIISYSYFRHPFKNGQPLEYRVATHAAVGEAMTITSVLFSGLGFVALIVTVWLQRTQVEAAIRSMEESTKAQQENLKTLRAQSDAALAAAKCSALSILVSLTQQKIDKARADWSIGKNTEEYKMLPELEAKQARYISLLTNLLEELLKKSDVDL